MGSSDVHELLDKALKVLEGALACLDLGAPAVADAAAASDLRGVLDVCLESSASTEQYARFTLQTVSLGLPFIGCRCAARILDRCRHHRCLLTAPFILQSEFFLISAFLSP